jgi:ELP3 family radical SAM enzyme/protein acetyltransferase
LSPAFYQLSKELARMEAREDAPASAGGARMHNGKVVTGKQMARPSDAEIAAKRDVARIKKAEHTAMQKAAQAKIRSQMIADANQMGGGNGVPRPTDPNNPDTYKKSVNMYKNKDVEDIHKRWESLVSAEELPKIKKMVLAVMEKMPETEKKMQKIIHPLRKELQIVPKKSQLLYVYHQMVNTKEIEYSPDIAKLLQKKGSKSESGVLVITVLTSPYPKFGNKVQRFSCKWNCYYCPNEPDQPRSYLHDEPAVLRANQNDFDAVLQFVERATTLAMMGHPVDKIELLVLGGTWASYPKEYREEFVRDLFYAANTFHDPRGSESRERLSIEEEHAINENAQAKIIGLTLETRPDCINPEEIKLFRKYGCTRVQLGLQHTDEGILKKINRGCTNQDAKDAIKLLKDSCYKLDIHLMPNLPGANAEIDQAMFDEVLGDPDLQCDQWKIYPCEIVPWTVIKKWHDDGKFTPYPDEELFELLMRVKAKVHPWIRLNRVVRDIPSQYILGGVNSPNARQYLQDTMASRGTRCNCIRCREVCLNKSAKQTSDGIRDAELVVRKYKASGADEHFISFESPDRTLICGFLRLRLSDRAARDGIFPELMKAALVRELHVYGTLIATSNKKDSHAQHKGFGRRMLARAELIAWFAGYKRMAIIAGIGTRNYYRKMGYEIAPGDGGFMLKDIDRGTVLFHALSFGLEKAREHWLWVLAAAVVVLAVLCHCLLGV